MVLDTFMDVETAIWVLIETQIIRSQETPLSVCLKSIVAQKKVLVQSSSGFQKLDI